MPVVTRNKSTIKQRQFNRDVSKHGLVMPIVMVFMLISQLVYWGLIHLNQTNSQRLINFNGYYQTQIQQMITHDYLTQPLDIYLDSIEQHVLTNLDASFDMMLNTLTIDQWRTMTPQVGIGTLHSSDSKERIFVYEHQVYLDESQLNYCLIFNVLFCEGKLNANNTYDPLSFDPSIHYFDDQTITSDTFEELTKSLSDEGFIQVKMSERNAQHVWQDPTVQNATYHFDNGSVSVQTQKTFYYLKTQLDHPVIELSSQVPYQILRYLIKLKGYYYERDLEVESNLIS